MKDKNVLVIGMGRSGKAAVEALVQSGARVAVQDSKQEEQLEAEFVSYLDANGVAKYLGAVPEDMGAFDTLVLSPGVPPQLDFVQAAKAAGAEIIGELELAYRLGSGKYVAITGTNGKTTTTTLVGEIYKASGRKTCVAGNIGIAVISKAMDADEDTWMVTETSSFQLETIDTFRPVVSAILNLTPDHMDRHKTMENYGRAKAAVFMNQTEDQYCVLNYDDKACFELAGREGCKATVVPFSRMTELDFGAFVKDGQIVIRDKDSEMIEICGADELKIPGSHNLENALAAAAIAYFGGIDQEVIAEVLRTFAGVEHRIEACGEVGGVRFVNDSKGTNPDAAIKAIEAMKENIILIAGGYDKGSEYDEFIGAFGDSVKKLILMGKTAPKIREAAEKAGFTDIIMANDMEDCVKKAYETAVPGDVVLLSPACASWDMYDNFEQRGDHFKSCVQMLQQN
ncbi:MAG: UDP-N-acetylmuramoyl-L-alanine--D-glutamate ligase [Bacillota bacterium]|nr:UDP-N-acetylmuramoyl-L-alanine--D-glutamate ligase [Bacillota bacterium]